MPNHFHLVMETPEANLVVGMKWFLGTHTARFNRRHKLSGHVFAGRYKSLLVGGEGGYLGAVCDYVHLNPARAKLLAPDAPLRSYRWSSVPMFIAEASERPRWLRVDRVFGESGIPQDSAAGRREFERRIEAIRSSEDAVSEEDLVAIRREWCFADESFRQELLAEMDGKIGASHFGAELQEAAEAKANRILREELEVAKWTEDQLESLRKGDPGKLRIARRLRAETTMTLQWIARRLHMGTKTHLSHLLYWGRRAESEGKSGGEAKLTAKISRASRRVRASWKKPAGGREGVDYRVAGAASGVPEAKSTKRVPKDAIIVDNDLSLLGTDPIGVGGFDTSFD
jgi:hypothetical protein